MKKEPRGTFQFRSDKKDNIHVIVCGWNDNNVVGMASNVHGVYPVGTVKRWSATEGKKVPVDIPSLVQQYSRSMGVDRLDQNVGAYRISMRTKKWWWPFFAYLLDVSASNAWLLYRRSPASSAMQLDLLSFKRSIVETYCYAHAASKTVSKPIALLGKTHKQKKRVSDDIRKNGQYHGLISWPTQNRCAHCGKKTKLHCEVCQVPLHRDCASSFHA